MAPVIRTFASDQTILQRGQVIDDSHFEVLQEYGLTQPTSRWQDLLSASLLTLATCAFIAYYLRRYPQLYRGLHGARRLVISAGLFVVFLLVARLTIPGHTVLPYVFPLMAYGLIISALFGARTAIVSAWPLALLTAYDLPFSIDLTTFYALSGLFGILALQRAQRVMTFFTAGAAIGLSGAAIAAAYRILEPSADWIGLATLAGAAIANGVASASLALVAHYLLAQLLGLPTGLQLTDLSRPDHPLLQYILRNSPGTYQHSLQLANLVENAAERIGADAQLARWAPCTMTPAKLSTPISSSRTSPPPTSTRTTTSTRSSAPRPSSAISPTGSNWRASSACRRASTISSSSTTAR